MISKTHCEMGETFKVILSLGLFMLCLGGDWQRAESTQLTDQQPRVQTPESTIQNHRAQNPRSENQEEQIRGLKERAKQYSRGWYWFYFISQGYTWLVLFLILWTGFSARLRQWAERVAGRRWKIILVYSGLFIGLLTILLFPLDLFVFWREKQYGFATQGFGAWLGDEIKELGVSCALGLPVILAVYTVFRKAPRTWWFWGASLLIGFVIFVVAVAPIFISPLFNTFEPLRDQALRQRILNLAHKHGIPADEVYQMDASRQSSHTNAYVVGLLGTQRIVLYDTLIQNFTSEEIEFIMAHEVGHYRLNHIWKGIGLSSVAILIGMWLLSQVAPWIISRYQHRLGFSQLADIASVPLLILLASLVSFAGDPLNNGISRAIERQADVFALRTAPQPEVAISVFEKFETLDLSEVDPPSFIEFWLYSHPSLKHRMETANEFLAQRSGRL